MSVPASPAMVLDGVFEQYEDVPPGEQTASAEAPVAPTPVATSASPSVAIVFFCTEVSCWDVGTRVAAPTRNPAATRRRS